MPTIDQLEPAQAVADTDELLASQGGTSRRVTRAQLVAGLQPQMTLAQGQFLGRASAGSGVLEPIALGPNLSLIGATLDAAAAPYFVSGLPAGATPAPADLVPIGQGGRNAAIPYAQFMAGLSSLPASNVSAFSVIPSGGSVIRSVGDLAADAIAVESFGAKGDGITDDTAAFVAAVTSGRPVRLASRTYVVNGQWTIAAPSAVLLGVPGQSVLKRNAQSGGAWISVQGGSFSADGIIFDANGAQVTTDSWGLLVTPSCSQSNIRRCAFINASGGVLGSGLALQASDPAPCQHVISDCVFAFNAVHGVWVQACAGVQVLGCRAHDNGQYGINVDFNDVTFAQKAHLVQVANCRAWNNVRGIAVGNFNATNSQPPIWGNANPDAVTVLVSGNICSSNSIYGIAVSGSGLAIEGNLLANNGSISNGGAGILANVSASLVSGNVVTGGAGFGIDCGGSVGTEVSGNRVSGAYFGINCGGSLSVRVADNMLQDCSAWAIVANNVESDGQGRSFGIACNNLALTGNWVGMSAASMGGIWLHDGPSNVVVARNVFVGTNDAVVGKCLWAATDDLLIEGNRWNASGRFTCNPITSGQLQQVVFPDIADAVMLTAAPSGVQSMISSFQAISAGGLVFARVTAGGSGYTTATVAPGGSGTGASAQAIISSGSVIGIAVLNSGSGYGPIGSPIPLAIQGDGSGATASAISGVPLPEERTLRVHCNVAVSFTRAGSSPLQENWTLADLSVPAYGDVDWTVTFGSWRAARATRP